MSTGQDEGVYVSAQHRDRRRRKIAGAIAGIAVVTGAGAYAVTTWLTGRDATVVGSPPIVTDLPTAPGMPATPLDSAPAWPAPGLAPATKSAVRQSSTPSPAPSPSGPTDDEAASAQVSRLLQPRADVAAAGQGVTVRNEVTPDGSTVRVVSARYDLASLVAATDVGKPVGLARCTRNVAGAQPRPGLLVCWRTSSAKSVVAVATRIGGSPSEAASAAVIDREWASLD